MAKRRRICMDTIVTRGKMPATTKVQGKRVAMSMELAHYFGFDRFGTRLWEMLAGACTIERLCSQLSEEFQVDRQGCDYEVPQLIRQLVRDGVVQIVDEAQLAQ